jgi:pre-60S factor REI1
MAAIPSHPLMSAPTRPSIVASPLEHDQDAGTLGKVGDEDTKTSLAKNSDFSPLSCIFCNQSSISLDANLAHMGNTHDMFIPDRSHLSVDVETLLAYMYLVVFDYRECLYCGVQRRTAEAAQHHMMERGHCRIDVTSLDSEFADFFDLESSEDDAEDGVVSSSDEEDEESSPTVDACWVQPDADTLRLPSGKLLTRQGVRVSRPKKPVQTTENPAPPPPGEPSNSNAVSRAARRDANFAIRHLASLRAEDRRSLMHLPASEQRAVLATQRKQVERARRTEWALRGRVEKMGNKTLMKHFVNDVPGRANG